MYRPQAGKLQAVLTLTLLVLVAQIASSAWAEEATATIERVKRSVVAVGTFARTRSPQFAFRGTGFIVDDGTLVVTNSHVVPGPPDPNQMEVTGILIPQPGGSPALFREAREVAKDADVDLALLKIVGTPLPAVRVGNSDGVKEGQDILITGFPIGAMLGPFAATHRGIIAAIAPIAIPQAHSTELNAKTARRLGAGAFNIFQLDATAYPGSSGSPVYDPATGQVIAIINMVLVKGTKEAAFSQPSGISYAVPAKYIGDLLQKAR
ncbi:MAG: serine protease [Casimicrobiaceae bacterium]